MYKIRNFAIITGLAISIAAPNAFAGSDTNNTNAQTEEAAEKTSAAIEGMLLPFMNPAKGRLLFASKGCVVCHSINGIGGEDAQALDATSMPAIMNPFEFSAKMWRGAATMISMQEDELGEQIEFSGEELAYDVVEGLSRSRGIGIFGSLNVFDLTY